MGLFRESKKTGVVHKTSDELLNDFLNSPLSNVEEDLAKRNRHQEVIRYIAMGKQDPAQIVKHVAVLMSIGGIVGIAQDPSMQAAGVMAATAAPLLPAARKPVEALRHKLLQVAHSMMPAYVSNEQSIIKDHMHYLFDKHGTTELNKAIKAEYPLLPESSHQFIEVGILQRAKDFNVIPQTACNLHDMRVEAGIRFKKEQVRHDSNSATKKLADSMNDNPSNSHTIGRHR